MPLRVLRLATLLSPALLPTYEYIAWYLGQRLAVATSLHATTDLDTFGRGEAEIGLLCGLLYVHLSHVSSCPVELLAAPVLLGARYQDAPVYFSDVIVRQEHAAASLEDIQGCLWAYNERASHSGYYVVQYSLLERGLPLPYFGRWLETGSHLQSLDAVLTGQADATALDSHLLDVLWQQQPALRSELRVIATLGPSPIPPLIIARSLPDDLKQRIRSTLLTMHTDPQAAHELHKGQIKRFVALTDDAYDPLRAMFARVQYALSTPALSTPAPGLEC